MYDFLRFWHETNISLTSAQRFAPVFLLPRNARKHRLGEGRVLFILSIYACFPHSKTCIISNCGEFAIIKIGGIHFFPSST